MEDALATWWNARVVQMGLPELTSDLHSELHDGVKLLRLVEEFGKKSVKSITGSRFNAKPKLRVHKLENCSFLLRCCEHFHLETRNVNAADIVDGRGSAIADLLRSIVVTFGIGGIGKVGLLAWCRQNTAAAPNLPVRNFHRDWSSGKLFGALVHNFWPTALDPVRLRADDDVGNFEKVFAAFHACGVVPLLDLDDLAAGDDPDEDMVIAQLSLILDAVSKKLDPETLSAVPEVAEATDPMISSGLSGEYVSSAKQVRERLAALEAIAAAPEDDPARGDGPISPPRLEERASRLREALSEHTSEGVVALFTDLEELYRKQKIVSVEEALRPDLLRSRHNELMGQAQNQLFQIQELLWQYREAAGAVGDTAALGTSVSSG